MSSAARWYACCFALAFSACGDIATLPEQADTGSRPVLAEPNPTKLIPTVVGNTVWRVAPARTKPQAAKPRPLASEGSGSLIAPAG